MNLENQAAVVLAAGRSRRMGTPKALLTVSGYTFFSEIAEALMSEQIPWTVCVTRPDLTERLYPLENFTALLENDDPESEQLDSLRIALRWLEENVPDAEGLFVLLVDNPGGLRERLQVMREAVDESPEEVLAAAYQGKPGHPMWLPRRLWKGLLEYSGKGGTEGFLKEKGELPKPIETEVPSATLSVDTPEDYERLREG